MHTNLFHKFGAEQINGKPKSKFKIIANFKAFRFVLKIRNKNKKEKKLKILFKNKTRYTKQIYKEFLEFHQEKYGATYMGYTVLLIILFIFCIILQIQSRNYLLSILTLCILIGFVFWRLYNPIKTVQKEKKHRAN